jgi:hypothetical protein
VDRLNHPRNIDEWHRWQDANQSVTRRVKRMALVLRDIARPDSHAGHAVLTRGSTRPRVLICLDARTPTAVQALLSPVGHLDPEDIAVLSPVPVSDLLPSGGWQETTGYAPELTSEVMAVGTPLVLSTGHYLPLGRIGFDQVGDPARFLTVQHGLMTPHAPPLAPGTTLLAWSRADADFWRSGRDDVTTDVVGSQLLWEAADAPRATLDPDAAPVFLGQLHGAELPREVLAGAAETFCTSEHATYRPHPSERDRRSVATHERWEASGITIDRSGIPLHELGAPVVSVFSTGVLEAAAAGLPAWVHCPDAPDWLRAFWDRYGLAPWGGPPTPSPGLPPVEPARAIAQLVEELMSA